MTRETVRFQIALVVSLGLHGVLTLLLVTFSGSGAGEPIQIYTVRIMEAPGRPQARELALSTQAISALKLDSPTLRTDTPPLPVPDTPEIPSRELLPPSIAERPRTDTPPSSTPALPAAAESLPAIRPPSATPQMSTPPGVTALPGLPQVPTSDTTPPAVPPPGPPAPPRNHTPPRRDTRLPEPLEDSPKASTLLDRTRGRIRQLNLEVDTKLPSPDLNRPQTPGTERNLLSLRLYSNRVREEVKKRFTFPGSFTLDLRTRVGVVLLRDGTVQSTKIIESSGNDRFDKLVCLAAITRAEIPEFPKNIEEDTLTLYFTCSP